MINEVALANTLQINIWLMLSNFPNSSGGWRWQWEHWLWGVSHNDVGQGISHLLILIKQILICGKNVVLWDKCCFVGQMLFCGTICDSQFMVWRKLNFSWRWRKMRSMRTFGRRSESLIGMETGIFMFEIWSEKIYGKFFPKLNYHFNSNVVVQIHHMWGVEPCNVHLGRASLKVWFIFHSIIKDDNK